MSALFNSIGLSLASTLKRSFEHLRLCYAVTSLTLLQCSLYEELMTIDIVKKLLHSKTPAVIRGLIVMIVGLMTILI